MTPDAYTRTVRVLGDKRVGNRQDQDRTLFVDVTAIAAAIGHYNGFTKIFLSARGSVLIIEPV